MENKNNKNKSEKKIKVKDKNGLTISYNHKEFDIHFPHLKSEITEKTKTIKINSINTEIEKNHKREIQDNYDLYPNELYNPGVIDFIRRCTKIEDAINILDFLLKRKEISQKAYNKYRKTILQSEGLKQLIGESGGFKRPGYYMRKYYKKDIKNQKLNSNKD